LHLYASDMGRRALYIIMLFAMVGGLAVWARIETEDSGSIGYMSINALHQETQVRAQPLEIEPVRAPAGQ